MEPKKIGFTGNMLKITAVVLMIIDHIGAALIENGILHAYDPQRVAEILDTDWGMRWYQLDTVLRTLGRPAFPIFCFLLAEGFVHTRNVKKYVSRMALFALISEVPFDLAIFRTPFEPNAQNVYFTLFIGLLVLVAIRKYENNTVIRSAAFLAGCGAAILLKTDYDAIGILLITAFYLMRSEVKMQTLFCGGVAALESSGNYCAGALALIPIRLYNGKRGKLKLKYFFYWFYPVHLLLLYLLEVTLLK